MLWRDDTGAWQPLERWAPALANAAKIVLASAAALDLEARLSLWSPDDPKRYRVVIEAETDRVTEDRHHLPHVPPGGVVIVGGATSSATFPGGPGANAQTVDPDTAFIAGYVARYAAARLWQVAGAGGAGGVERSMADD